jgi:hypothetical protein
MSYEEDISEHERHAREIVRRDRDKRSLSYHSVREDRIKESSEQSYLLGTKDTPIWPEGETHILSGVSGVGKSTVWIPLLKDWSEGKDVMGFKSNPLPFVYIMCDGSDTSLQHRLERLGLEDWDIPAYSVEMIAKKFSIDLDDLSLEMLPEIFKWARVFVIESISFFYKSRSSSQTKDYVDTLRLAAKIRKEFGSKRTILATSHQAKMIEGKGYANIRDKPHGTVAQAATSGTVMSMEKGKGRGTRLIHFSPRDYAEFTAEYLMGKKGRLDFQRITYTEAETEEEKEDPTAFKLFDRKLTPCAPKSVLERSLITEWGNDLMLSEATIDRWIKEKITKGELKRVSRGMYWVCPKLTEQ